MQRIAANRMGSEAGSPLRPHAFSNFEHEGVMVTPIASLYNCLNQGRINKSATYAII